MTKLLKLYKKTIREDENMPIQSFSDDGYSVLIFKPTLFRFGIDNSERINRFLLYFVTMGRYRILYVMKGHKVLHYSFIIPKTFRFPFMGPNELEIGPCFTDIHYRGRGIYTRVLQLIPYIFKESAKTFWIYTVQSNIISQKAIEKSEFNYYGLLRITGILRILKQA
jgi:hypothetical protein